MELKLLDEIIENMRQQMIESGMKKGFCNIETLRLSEQVDKLMNDFNEIQYTSLLNEMKFEK